MGVDDRLALASVAEAMKLEICLLMLMHKQQGVLSGSVESFCAYARHRMDQMREIWRDAARPEQTFAPEKTTLQPSKPQIHLKGNPGSIWAASRLPVVAQQFKLQSQTLLLPSK
jgi:hypothetical protein